MGSKAGGCEEGDTCRGEEECCEKDNWQEGGKGSSEGGGEEGCYEEASEEGSDRSNTSRSSQRVGRFSDAVTNTQADVESCILAAQEQCGSTCRVNLIPRLQTVL
jgi:hypothetical protein